MDHALQPEGDGAAQQRQRLLPVKEARAVTERGGAGRGRRALPLASSPRRGEEASGGLQRLRRADIEDGSRDPVGIHRL